MAEAGIGEVAEARMLQPLNVDFIDEIEVLTPADEEHHVDKHAYNIPFVCGARNLGEALRRIAEGAAMIRTKGEAGLGNIVEAVRRMPNHCEGNEAAYRFGKRRISPRIQEIGCAARTGAVGGASMASGGSACRMRWVDYPGGESTTMLSCSMSKISPKRCAVSEGRNRFYGTCGCDLMNGR